MVPGVFDGFLGFLDANGNAFPVLNTPPLQRLVGRDLYAAYITLDATSPVGVGEVSNSTVTTITDLAPSVAGITPNTGPVSGGTLIVIHGDNFQSGASVAIGGAPATNVSVLNSTTITCVTPMGLLGQANVTVTHPDTTSNTLVGGYLYVPTLVLNSVGPVVAPPFASVTVMGAGFQNGLSLVVGGIATTPTFVTPNLVIFTNPPGVPCNSYVTILNPEGQSQSILFNPTPVINNVLNAIGPASGGGSFFLLGSHFHQGTTVTIGGTPASLLGSTVTSLLVQAPPGTPGAATIQVNSTNGCSTSSPTPYTYQ